MPDPDFTIKLGDTASSIRSTLLDDDGDAVDIALATVRFHARLMGGTPVIDAPASNLQSGTTDVGLVEYTWGTIPSESGVWLGEWEVAFQGGAEQTFPNTGPLLIRVPEQIA